MRYAVIENGVVVNVVIADPQVAAVKGWIRSDDAGPGWRWDGAKFDPPPRPPAPPTLNPRAPQLAVLDAKIAALPDGDVKDALLALRALL